MTNHQEHCPQCKKSLQGESIPVESQHLFNATHFSKKIGIYDRDLDMTTHYECPYCKGIWER